MPEGLELGVSGLASNFDWLSLVDQLTSVERAPQQRMLLEQQAIQDRQSAYSTIVTQLGVLQNRVEALNSTDLFESRLAISSNSATATASASTGAAIGSYAFNISQRAAAAVRQGTANIGAALSPTSDVSGVILSNAAFAPALKTGTFTVNGQQITVASTDTLQGVFDKISAATGGDITGSYDPGNDHVTLTSGSAAEIVLGSATDTSNFLQVFRLSNNGTDSTASSSSIGAIRLTGALSDANFGTAVDNGGGGSGAFKVNGVEISYDVSVDSVSDVLKRINDSSAGVTASYDPITDRFNLTSKVTGDIGIALEDVTGNFLTATGLIGGMLQRGKDLLYTVDNGGQLSSRSNTITGDSSGIAGLSVNVVAVGETTVEVASDAAKIKKAITDFIEDYNKVQGVIDTSTASTTDSKGKVTAGTLAGEGDAFGIASELRRFVSSSLSSLTGTVKRLESLGISTNGDDNKIALSDSGRLDAALADHLNDVKSLFTHSTEGLAARLSAYLEKTVGDDGSLTKKQANLDKQVAAIDDQIAAQERQVQANRQLLITSFLAMEQAQQQINQQIQFLSQRFGVASS
jgi:flagellar hook-associated protein 2